MRDGLIIKNLTTGYPGQKVIHELSLAEIPPGSVVGLVGPNAAGKSTLLKALAGLRPFTGMALMEDRDLGALTADDRLSVLGYLPQSLPLASSLLTYECVLSACRIASPGMDRAECERRIEQVLSMLNLGADAFRRVVELSGGKRQLVGLAQVLVREPRLMLLDEPTSALDLKWQIQVLSFVQAAAKERQAIAIIAAHDINLAMRFCDILLVLSQGKCLASGAPLDVVTPEILREAYGVEARVERCSKGLPVILADSVAAELPAAEKIG